MAARSERQKPHLLYRARKSSKCFSEASNDVPITALGDGTNGLHLLHTCHIAVATLRDMQYHESVELVDSRDVGAKV